MARAGHGSKTGVENYTFVSELRSKFGDLGGTPPQRISRIITRGDNETYKMLARPQQQTNEWCRISQLAVADPKEGPGAPPYV